MIHSRRAKLSLFPFSCIATLCLLSVMAAPVFAHHGGLGIEGDLVDWALKIDQWQDEVIDQGLRIKFLSYPRHPVRGSRTRLVFELQSVASGRYVSGLTAQLQVQAPDGAQRTMPLPETTGVTAYYEAVAVFEQIGEHRFTLRTTMANVPASGTFHKVVKRSALMGDWATVTGNVVVLATFAITWVALVLSLQRRFMGPAAPP
ncbi:hypothetical protein NKDENANG_03804 [Candidatus Entotheonellaceae bacterium PAL068K]